MSKHIGIVAVTAEGAALCYQTICAEGSEVLGPRAHPEVSLHNFPLARYWPHAEAGDWDGVGEILLESAEKLRKTGAEFLICPANTPHLAIDRVRSRSPLPWLHIVEEVAATAESRGLKRLLLLGTRWLMEDAIYPRHLSRRGIACEIPDEDDRARIDDIVFKELVLGRLEDGSRGYLEKMIRDFGDKGCDGVILGCTEIPLLIPEDESPLPALDSTRLLARAALREAMGQPVGDV